MDLARLLWARVTDAHTAVGAPVEPFDCFVAGSEQWTFHAIGVDGVLGICAHPERDGDSLVIALPTRPSHAATLQALAVIHAHLATGRALYTMAWKNHWLALNINQRIGGELLGFDNEGFHHFKHTLRGMQRGQEKYPYPA